MSRRTHACLTCPGRTRHDNRVCAACRRRGRTAAGRTVRVTLLLDVPDFRAPSRADLEGGVDLTPMLSWPGTDMPGRAGDRVLDQLPTLPGKVDGIVSLHRPRPRRRPGLVVPAELLGVAVIWGYTPDGRHAATGYAQPPRHTNHPCYVEPVFEPREDS